MTSHNLLTFFFLPMIVGNASYDTEKILPAKPLHTSLLPNRSPWYKSSFSVMILALKPEK